MAKILWIRASIRACSEQPAAAAAAAALAQETVLRKSLFAATAAVARSCAEAGSFEKRS
jgi:hypothetical protein